PEGLFVALVLVVALRHLLNPLPIPALDPWRPTVVATGAYAAIFAFITITRHLNLMTHALDLGQYVQIVWSMASGYGPRMSLPEMHAWGDHLSPILWGLVPLFWIVPGPETLLVVQAFGFHHGAAGVSPSARARGSGRPLCASLPSESLAEGHEPAGLPSRRPRGPAAPLGVRGGGGRAGSSLRRPARAHAGVARGRRPGGDRVRPLARARAAAVARRRGDGGRRLRGALGRHPLGHPRLP